MPIDGGPSNPRTEFHDSDGNLVGFAVTGKRIKERMPLSKQMPVRTTNEA